MLKLTNSEEEIFNYIKWFKVKNGYSPTTYEIADGIYKSRQHVRHVLESLKDKGFINYQEKKVRTIVINKSA